MGIKEAFRTLSLVDEKSVVSTPGYKAMKVFIQALLINTVVIRIAKHTKSSAYFSSLQ